MATRVSLGKPGRVVGTPWGPSDSLRGRMLPPGPGTPAAEVAQNQRERLFGAMVACVSELGYTATRVTDLVELSGVSRRSFYAFFPDKEACFQATIKELLSTGVELALAAESEGTTWEERAINRFQAFARLVAAQPAAGRMALIEALAAGPEVLKTVEEAVGTLEMITQQRFGESPDHADTPPEMITAFVGATLEIARTRLHRGRQDELPDLIPDLMELLLSYRPPPEPLRLATRPPTPAPESIDAPDHGERALRAFAVVAAERGYANTTINQIVKRAAMSPTTFYANFTGMEDLLTAAIDSAGAQMTAAVLPAFRRSSDWTHGVRAAFGAFFNFLASRPALAQLVMVEVYAAGREAVEHREEALRPLEVILAEGRARSSQVSGFAVEAITSGIYALTYKQIRQSGAGSLTGLAPLCTYFNLSPFIGAEKACEAANGDGQARGTRRPDLPHRMMLPQVLRNFNKGSATAEQIADRIGQPVGKVRPLIEELKGGGVLEIADEWTRDGAPEVLYRSVPGALDDAQWAQLSLAERREISEGVGHLITGEIDQALEVGAFDSRIDRYLTRLPFCVDEQGWRELMAIHEKAFQASLQVWERSDERLKQSGKPGIEGRSVQALFEAP